MWIWLLLTVTIYLSKISIKNPMHQCIHIMTFLCKRCNKSIKKDKQSACNCGAPYWLHCQNYRCRRAQTFCLRHWKSSSYLKKVISFNRNWSFFQDYFQKRFRLWIESIHHYSITPTFELNLRFAIFQGVQSIQF